IPLSKAEQIWDDYRNGLPVLFRWISNVIATARAKGFTQTYILGRRRPLVQFYKARGRDARRLAAYADRCAVNTWVQGTGADATRIAMARIKARLERE
ncbi:MAG: bifunctional 3'-5' exonuclease/DNA polymerase, partial [Gemmatimonadales bacterium]|nr:bifunctional 3'-5' exonuclease/DNA polymerase [Gemmatimonadales bacterium]